MVAPALGTALLAAPAAPAAPAASAMSTGVVSASTGVVLASNTGRGRGRGTLADWPEHLPNMGRGRGSLGEWPEHLQNGGSHLPNMGRGRGTLGEWPEHLQNGGSGAATATAAVLAAGKTSTASASAHEKVTTAVPNMERLGTDDEEVLTRALDGGTISSDGVLPNLGRVGAVSSDGVADSACNAAGAFTAATLASTATEAPLPPASPDMEAPLPPASPDMEAPLAPAPPPPPPMKASDLAAALLPAPLTASQQSQGQQLHALHRAKQGTHKWNEMQAARDKLPAAAKRRAVLSALEGHSVLVVSGETGCGKTTQVCPHFCWPRGVPLIAPNPLPNLAGASIHPGRRHRVRPCRRRLDHLHPASSLKCYRCGDSGGR